MSLSVWVLCPNGHRIIINLSPNTTLNEIKQEACAKEGFQSSKYGLKKEDMKKHLDLSLPFRFSGLSNRCKLELCEEEQKSVMVNIAVQLESGARLEGKVLNTTSLLETIELITGLSRFGNETELIYLQKKIKYSEFGSTTLFDIGILQGSSLLRLEGVELTAFAQMSDDVTMEVVPPTQSEPQTESITSDEDISMHQSPTPNKTVIQVNSSSILSTSSSVTSRLDRIPVLFNPKSETSLDADLGDEFYEVTERDIRTLLRDLNAITERPFKLPSKEGSDNDKIMRDDSIIRIRLPGGYILQNIFSTKTSSTDDLYNFVSQYLTTDTANKLGLFLAPPKRTIVRGVSLTESGLEGTVLVHAGGSIKLKPDLHVVSQEEAVRQLEKVLESSKPCNNPATSRDNGNVPTGDSYPPTRKPASDPGAKKKVVPKWFKM